MAEVIRPLLRPQDNDGNINSSDIRGDQHRTTAVRNVITGNADFAEAQGSKYESLDYDPVENYVFHSELKDRRMAAFRKEAFMRWMISLAIGVLTAGVALFIDMGITLIADFKFHITTQLIGECNDCFAIPFLTYICCNTLLVAVAAWLVAFIEPVAAGSGIPEIKCYLNGVKYPRVVRVKTLVVKAIGVLFSVAGGMACGKEGPMIHSGAIIAAGLSQGKSTNVMGFKKGILKKVFSPYHNDQEKRDFVSGGAAAGVAAAFGAPVGGVLFSLEEGSSFWNQALTWRTFAGAMICSFTLNVLLSGMVRHQWGKLTQAGLAVFGSFEGQSNPGYTVGQIPFFLVLGVLGGLIGALFIYLNIKLARFRVKYISSAWTRSLEALIVGAITSIASFLISSFVHDCRPIKGNIPSDPNAPTVVEFTYFCPKGTYNAMATIFFTTQEQAIRTLFHSTGDYELRTLAVFFVVYFCLACLTYGVFVPSGLFVPCILMGCALGRLIGEALYLSLGSSWEIDPGVFALVGGAAVLGGVVRMTLSLTVIIVEATNDITYGLPIMMTLLVAKWVGDYFGPGIYDAHIEEKHVPFLEWEPPIVMRKFRAISVMARRVVHIRITDRVSRVLEVLKETKHNGFPVVDDDDHFQGMILRSQLCILLKMRAFARDSGMILAKVDDFVSHYPRFPPLDESSFSDTDKQCFMDLSPYVNISYTIQQKAPLQRVFRLFRTMGLRHLPVLDDEHHVVGIITRHDLTHLEDRLLRRRRQNRAYTSSSLLP